MMTNLLKGAHVANKLFSTIARLRLLLVMFLTLTVSTAWGADNLFNVTSYNSIPSGWTNSGVTTGSYFNFNTDNCSLTSPLYDPHTDLSLTYKVATYGSGTNHPLTIQLLDENGNVKQTHTTGTPTSSSYISGTWSIGTVNYKFKIKFYLAKAGKGVRLQTPKLVGNPATSTEPYTVTLVPGSGSVTDTELEEPNAGEGVTLPTPTLDCGDWEFAGWKTTSAVTTETTTEPTLIAAGNYKPSNNITLYAVYQRTETTSGGGGGSTEVTFNFGYTDWGKAASFSGTTYNTVQQNDNGVSVTYTRNDGSLYANTTSLRLYKTNTLTFDAGSNTITSITFTGNIGQSDITTDAGTCTNTTNTLSWAGSSKSVTFTRPSNASSYATLTSATLTIGGGSTTYYHSTPDCGSTEPSRCVTPKMRG